MAKREKKKTATKEAPKKVVKVAPKKIDKEAIKKKQKELEAKRKEIKEMKFVSKTAFLAKRQPEKETLVDFYIENEDGETVFRREHIDHLDKETRKVLDV